MKKSVISLVGNILMIITLYFLIDSVIKLKIPFGQFIYDVKFMVILTVLILIMVSVIFFNAGIYSKILIHFSKKQISKLELSNIYITSNIAKYLPGNVMHFVGRNIIGVKYGIEHKAIAIATSFEILLILFSCIILALLTGYKFLVSSIEWYIQNNFHYIVLASVITVLIFISIMVLIINKRKTEDLRNIIKKDNLRVIFKTLAMDVLVFIITSSTYVILSVSIIGHKLAVENLFIIFSVYLISWLFGYLTPGAPGGIGIREMILIMLLDGILTKDVVVTSTIIHRFITIMADILAFALFNIYIKFSRINFNGGLQ